LQHRLKEQLHADAMRNPRRSRIPCKRECHCAIRSTDEPADLDQDGRLITAIRDRKP
jgi:hypothetical protein